MPLPDRDQPWPPTDPVLQNHLADWDAWYSSEPSRLEARYSNRAANPALPLPRPSQYAGGLLGRAARWWWGQPVPPGEKDARLHVPLAGDIARTSADLLFSEPPAFVADSDATQARLDQIATGLHPTLLEAGELCAALGGVYLRIVWDGDVSARPWIAPVPADAAVPDFAYGTVLRAVTFWRTVRVDGQQVWRHLERHEKGRIYHGLYLGDLSNLGQAVPLEDDESTAPLAAEVDADGGLDTGAPDHLTAEYIPNVRPARAWRHIPGAAGWGQSDYQGIEPLMDALDETYSSWMRDIRIGKGRVIVSQGYLTSNGPGQGASMDLEREVYAGLNIPPTADAGITLNQFAIRVTEHRDTARELMEQAVRQAGYSAASFGSDSEGQAITATEVKAKLRRSMTTRGRKSLYWVPGLDRIVLAQLAVEAGPKFKSGVPVEEVSTEFQDSITEAPHEVAETAALLRQAEAASTETLVRMQHPDWDDDQVSKETEAILGESGRMLADPAALGDEQPMPGEPPTP